jgi:hypothetical protein
VGSWQSGCFPDAALGGLIGLQDKGSSVEQNYALNFHPQLLSDNSVEKDWLALVP